jgi:ferric-dicitrate binding protein FerR (iron transport regulator)
MSNERDRRSEGLDEIAQLIARAGPRPEPAVEIEQSVRAAVESAWQEANAQRSAQRRTRWLAVAASLAAITGGLLWVGMRHRIARMPADTTLLAVRGGVTVNAADRRLVVAGSHLPVGTTLGTSKDGFVLMTVAAESVRVGPGSRVRIGPGGRLRLSAGRIYVETTGTGHAGAPLIVSTPFGRISHLGTQFQVVVGASDMAVSVRSGHVRVKDYTGNVQRLRAGEEVEVLSGGAVRRSEIRPYGPDWAWADSLVPDLPIDGRPLTDFLDWYSRETGLRLVLLGPGTAAAIHHTVLSGSIAGMTPNQALVAVMATTRFKYDTKVPGELRIRMRSRAD